jgi:hypothetical protein
MAWTPNREELAWAAGFFDGEGSIGVVRHAPRAKRGEAKSNTSLQMTLVQSGDSTTEPPELLLRFQRAVAGLGGIRFRRSTNHLGKRPIWIWRITSASDVQAVAAMLWPWFGLRNRDRARRSVIEYRAALFKWQDRTSCHRGHPFDGENTYWEIHVRNGVTRRTRLCRACARERQALMRQRQRALPGGG